MSILNIVMIILGASCILSGFLYGLKRGLYKSIARLVIILLCVFLAFYLRANITDTVLSIEVNNGKTIIELITESVASGDNAEAMQGLVDVIVNIIKMLVQILVFVVAFGLLRIVSMIVYWIVAGIIGGAQKQRAKAEIENDTTEENRYDSYKDKKKLIKRKVKSNRKKWSGALVGIIQAVIIISCVVGPLNGLIKNGSSIVKTLSEIEIGETKIIEDDVNELLDDIGLFAYNDSTVCKVYSTTGDVVYNNVSKVIGPDGEVVNVASQIEAISGGLKMVGSVLDITNVDLSNGLTSESKEQLVDIFNNLESIKSEMSEESVEELNNLVKDTLAPMLGESTDLPINLEDIDFNEVNFAKEGEVVSSLFDLMEKVENDEPINTEETLEEVITTLSESNLILPILSDMAKEESLNLSEEDKNKAKEIIDNLENQENVEELKALFGIE